MFISTDFKKKYKEKAIGQSKALDACTIVKEAQTPLGCLYYNANVNAVYICDYKFNPALKERVRSVMPEKTSVSQDVKNTIVELLIHAKIVTLNKKGRPEQRYGLSNPPVFEWVPYLKIRARFSQSAQLCLSSRLFWHPQHLHHHLRKEEVWPLYELQKRFRAFKWWGLDHCSNCKGNSGQWPFCSIVTKRTNKQDVECSCHERILQNKFFLQKRCSRKQHNETDRVGGLAIVCGGVLGKKKIMAVLIFYYN